MGSYLAEALLGQGFNVIAIDNLSVGESKRNIESLLQAPNFSFWEVDVNKTDFKLSPAISLTHVFHLAAVEEHLFSSNLSLQTLLVNSLGTKNLLDLALERKAKFILLSSSEVYHAALSQVSLDAYFGKGFSNSAQLSFSEAKRFAEALTAEYFKKYDLNTTILRIKDPYGPRMSLTGGDRLAALLDQALHKNKIELEGDGLKTFNPTFVTDIVFGIIKAALQNHRGEIFNLISPEKYTERTIAEYLQKILGGIEIVYKKGSELELPSYPLILDSTKEKLGWTPKVSLGSGLSETATYFRGKETKPKVPNLEQREVPPAVVKEVTRTGRYLLTRVIGLTLTLLIAGIIIFPPATVGVGVYLGTNNLRGAIEKIEKNDPKSSVVKAERAETAFKNSQEASQSFFWPSLVPGLKEPLEQTKSYLFLVENVSGAVKFTAQALADISKAEALTKPEEIATSLGSIQGKINSAQRSLEIASSVKIDENKLPSPLKKNYQQVLKEEKRLQDLINSLSASL